MNDSEQLITELRTFFRKGSHDLRNLFQMLHLWLQTADSADHAQATKTLAEMQTYYQAEIDRLGKSFDELLSVGSDTAPAIQVNVAASLEATLRSMASVLAETEAQIDQRVDPAIELHFSEVHLRNAWRVLLDNALRYRSPARSLMVQLRARVVKSGVVLSVRDNGVGIDMARYRQQVFAPFVRCTDRSEGQGISLHLLKLMTEQHGGKITMESTVGQGTRAELYLPHQ